MGYQIAGDPVPEGEDQSAAPLEEASPDAATALAVDPGNPEAVPQGAPAPSSSGSGKVTLAPVPPLGSVTLPPLEDGGEGIVIAEGGTEVERGHRGARPPRRRPRRDEAPRDHLTKPAPSARPAIVRAFFMPGVRA